MTELKAEPIERIGLDWTLQDNVTHDIEEIDALMCHPDIEWTSGRWSFDEIMALHGTVSPMGIYFRRARP